MRRAVALSSSGVKVDQRERTTRKERFGRDATIRASNCISAEELGSLRDGRLPETRRKAITEHLAECAACREFYSRLGPRGGQPERIGRYLVEGRLGAGGMGVVYKAVDPNLDRRVAIKVVRPEQLGDDARRRLLREARALAKISHPNVVTVHDVGEHEQQVFVATEFVDGETMATWQVGRDWRALIEAWIQVARGLSAAHAGGIVHRDVKPSNVFVGRDGRVRIGDFGIARSHEGDSAESSTGRVTSLVGTTVTSAVAGTPGYMAPEQFRGEVDARSDQFALCVAIIEGLTGRRPEAGTVPPMPESPALLRRALIRGLAVDPSARFATIAELADALAAALQIPASPAPRSWSRRRILILFAGAATTAVIAALIATRLESHSDPVASEGNVSSQQALTSVIAPSHEGVPVAESAPGRELVPPPNVDAAPGKELARSTSAYDIVTRKATPDPATGLSDAERSLADKPDRALLRRNDRWARYQHVCHIEGSAVSRRSICTTPLGPGLGRPNSWWGPSPPSRSPPTPCGSSSSASSASGPRRSLALVSPGGRG